jgi:hypothetical protein
VKIPKDATFALHRFGPESALRQTAFASAARIRAIETKETYVRGSKVEGAGEAGAETIFIGREFGYERRYRLWYGAGTRTAGAGRSGPERRDRGSVPPHRAEAIRTALHEEARVEATGVWQERWLHAYTITAVASGASAEAHEPTTSSRGKAPGPHRPFRREPRAARRGGTVALAAPDDAVLGRTTGLPGVRAGSYNTSF